MAPYIHLIIPTYGFMAVLGIITAVSWLYYRSIKVEKYCIDFKDFLWLCLFCGVGCLIGSRLLFVVTQIPELISDFSFMHLIQKVFGGGFVFYGGLLGALAANVIFCKVKKYNLDDVMDFTVPAFALFHAFGRVGCFFAGCCYGFKFENPVIIYDFMLFNYFPIQLVEVLFEIVMFFILKGAPDGSTLKTYLLSYAVFRFVVEFFRGDEARGIWLGISTSQWVSLFIILSCMYIIFKNKLLKYKYS